MFPAILRRIRNADSQKKRKRRVIRENAARMWVWIQESWDVWEEEEFSEGGERMGGPARKRVLDWVSDPLSCGFGKANSSSRVPQRSLPTPIFFRGLGAGWRAVATHAILPSPLHFLASAQLGAKIAWMWGKGRSDGEPWKKACLTLALLCSCGNLCQVKISRAAHVYVCIVRCCCRNLT